MFLYRFAFGLLLVFSVFGACHKTNNPSALKSEACNPESLLDTIARQRNIPGDLDSLRLILASQILERPCRYSADSLLLPLADSFHALGNKYKDTEFAKARTHYLAALRLRQDFFRDRPHVDLLRAYSNIGLCYAREGRHLDALRYYDSAEVRQEAFMVFPFIYNSVKKAESLMELGSLSQAQIQLENAYQQLQMVVKGTIKPDAVSWARASFFIFDLMVNYALNLQKQKRFHGALQKGIEGLELVRTFGPSSDSLNQLAVLFLTLGNIAQDSAKEASAPNQVYSIAHGYYDQAIAYFSAAGAVDHIILTLSNKGSIYEKAGDYQKAASSLQDAIGLLNRFYSGSHPQSLPLSINMGTVLARQGRFGEAMAAYQYALAKIDSNANSRKILPDIQGFYKRYDQSLVLLASLGRLHLWLAEKNPQHVEASQTSYDSLASLIDYVRANLIDDQAKIALAEKSWLWIPDAIKDIVQLYRLTGNEFYKERAFQMSEYGKAFSLLEASRLNNASELLPETLRKMQQEVLELQLAASMDAGRAAEAEKKQRDFLALLQSEAPSYFALKYQGVDLGIRRIQNEILDSNQAMLVYSMLDSSLLVFLVSRDTFILDTIQSSADQWAAQLEVFHKTINPVHEDGTLLPEKAKRFSLVSHSLYESLVGRITKRHVLPQRLIIIPDGILGELPFDALLTGISQDGSDLALQAREGRFLIQQHAISYCFSANMLREMMRHKRQEKLKPGLALFAPGFHRSSRQLPYLHNQAEEIKAIHSVIPFSKTDQKSSKDRFIKASREYAYLHISTHGSAASDPDHNFISFTQTKPEADSSQFLFLKELYHHRMDQELISLTACETAVGVHREGEGTISMARGFAYAGVRSFITTLWKIPTSGATKIIPDFYQRLHQLREPKDVALAESKRSFIRDGKNIYPENWAGLVLIGSSNSQVELSEPKDYRMYLLGSVLLVILLWVFFRFRKTQA